jgi:hypothetical protein
MTKLHAGKRTEEAKTTVTEAMHGHIADLARAAGCSPSDLVCDAIYMAFTGQTYAEHVANDRRAVMQSQGRQGADNTHSNGSAL